MADIIQLLPDSVANQIAAGEVVQRPASVVKELVENSIDAGSTKVQVIIKDAGKTLIQVIDNGCGMSDTDARMCFERHATSKISSANDLFNIRTMGFRGEAMASIAAIATVELKTKKHDDDLGTHICISGSKVEIQEPTSCQNGSNISVKNLFFNVPARRKFLKSNSTELKHIMEEFQRVALANAGVELHLIHNDVVIYNLPLSNIQNRIVNILGKSAAQNMISIHSETSMVNLKGYVGKPENARKSPGEQFFFVNNRFMKHPYFYKAVAKAYEGVIPQGAYPSFFIYFDVDADTIDINIHPTKTEIKFENERAIWPILEATIKEGLGKTNMIPSIDFEQEHRIDLPIFNRDTVIKPPTISVNPNYNPFDTGKNAGNSSGMHSVNTSRSFSNSGSSNTGGYTKSKTNTKDWQQLYAGFETKKSGIPDMENIDFSKKDTPNAEQNEQLSFINEKDGLRFFQVKGRYILTAVKSGLMLIDQKRAHQRILFDEYIYKKGTQSGISQKLLYPQKVELGAIEAEMLKGVLDEINRLGFDICHLGGNSFVVNSVPAEFPNNNIDNWISDILDNLKEDQKDFSSALRENLVRSLAKFLSIPYGKRLSQEEMAEINDKLFASVMPNLTPEGKPIIAMLSIDEIEKLFK